MIVSGAGSVPQVSSRTAAGSGNKQEIRFTYPMWQRQHDHQKTAKTPFLWRDPYLERFIHGEIYRLYPEVGSVVHSHSPAVIPFGVGKVPLRPLYHMSGFLGGGAPVFEIRDVAGPATDMLIRNRELGCALAIAMGGHPVILMRGHGSTVVGPTVRQAVFRAVYTEVNARMEGEALRLGDVTFLNEQEATAAMETNAGQVDRPWELWRKKAMAGG